MQEGTIALPMADIEAEAKRNNDLYLLIRISHPSHGTDAVESVAAVRRAKDKMMRDLPQVGPGYMSSVHGQSLYISDDGPILNVGIYDATDVPVAFPRLVGSLESDGWSGEVRLVGHDERTGATYLPDGQSPPKTQRVDDSPYAAPRPAVAAPVSGKVIVDSARVEHSWQESMDRHFGWLVLAHARPSIMDAAVVLSNGVPEAAQRVGANLYDAGRDDQLQLGAVQVSAVGPFVELSDIGDVTRLRELIGELAQCLERDGLEGVLTTYDPFEGPPV